MANTLLTASVITKEFMAILHNSMNVTRNVDHSWNSLFGKSFGPISPAGATVNIRVPVMLTHRTSWQMNVQDVVEKSVPLTINVTRGVDLDFSDAELSLSIDDLSRRVIQPAASKLAAMVDSYVATYMIQNTYNAVGTPGTSPNNASFFLDANRRLNEMLAPIGGRRVAVITPRTESTMVGPLAGQYNPQPWVSEMFEKGAMPLSTALGLEWYSSALLPAHTCGTRTNSTPVVATYTGATRTFTITGAGNAVTYAKGDVFTVAGVYAVNPETKTQYGFLQQFVVEQNATSDSSGNLTLVASPEAIATGAYQNVSKLPSSSDAITNLGTSNTSYEQNLVFAPEACAVAFAELPIHKDAEECYTISQDGISLRYWRASDIINGRVLARVDVFFGVAMTRPELCVRVYGA